MDRAAAELNISKTPPRQPTAAFLLPGVLGLQLHHGPQVGQGGQEVLGAPATHEDTDTMDIFIVKCKRTLK